MQSPTCVSNLSLIPSFDGSGVQLIVEPTLVRFSSHAYVREIVAALYCITDMIIFKVMEDIYTGEKIVSVCITINDVNDTTFVVPFDSMDSALVNIYNYVKSKSLNVFDDGIYFIRGTHICRQAERNYSLFSYQGNPIGDTTDYTIMFPDGEQIGIYEDINRNMIAAKRL